MESCPLELSPEHLTDMISPRIDFATAMQPESFSVRPPVPHAVKIELCRTCNHHCSFCAHAGSGLMDWDLYCRIVDECKEIGVKEVAPFFFGESFLAPRLAEAIRYAKSKDFELVFLTTNGTACTEEKLKACFEAGLDSLKFSLNYADAGQFAEITRTPERLFQRLKDNIKAAWKIRQQGDYHCGLYASYIRFDSDQDKRIQPLLDELEPFLDEIYALPIYSQAAKIQMEGWQFSGGNRGRADKQVPPVPCWGLFRACHINYDGTVCGCCFSVGDEFTMGDVKKQTLMEAWHSKKFQTLRQSHLNHDVRGTACESCIKQVAT